MAEYTGEVLAERPNIAPAGAAPAPSMDEQYAEKERKLREEYDKKVKEATTSEVTVGDRTFEVPSFFTSTAGLVTGAGAVIGAGTALYGASKVAPAVYQAVKNRWINKVPEIDRTIDIPMDATPVAPVSVQATTELAKPAAPAAPDLNQRAAEIIKANQQAGLGGQPMSPVAPIEAAPMAPVAPVDPVAPVASVAPVAPVEAPISTPLSSAPVDAPAPLPSAKPGSAATEIVADEIKNLMTEADKPVAPEYPKKTTFKSAAEIPPGFEFRPDVGNLDRSMGNILGKEHREQAREWFAGGKKFGQSANLNDDVSRLTTQYFQNLQQQIPETILGRDARKLQNIPSEFGTFAKNTNFGKGVKVGGVAGTLFAISDLANAQTAGQRGIAGANLLEAVLPPSMMIGGAGEGSSAVPSANAAMLLGSPYAQSDIAKKRRQQEEYTRKVGAGRGIAPPSAYMR
jgi:hypothetical protein